MSTLERIQEARHSGDNFRAILIAEEALSLNPNNTDILVQLGYLWLSSDLVAAEQAFRKALRYAPHYHDATLGLAIIHFRRGEVRDAERLVLLVLSDLPDYADARALLESIKSDIAKPGERAQGYSAVVARSISAPSVTDEPDPVPPSRRFISFGSERSFDARRESASILSVVHASESGWTIGGSLRTTSRPYGGAHQAALALSTSVGTRAFGIKLAAASGADNLPDRLVQLSFQQQIDDRWAIASSVEWRWYRTGDIAMWTPAITLNTKTGTVFALRFPLSKSSEVDGFVHVADFQVRVPINDRLELRAGAVYGTEFDQATTRRVRSLSVGASRQLDEYTRASLGFSTGPYADTSQMRLSLGLTRRF